MRESGTGLQVQFDNLAQQREADTLGMWIFLATEALFFGGLFLAYAVYRWASPVVFTEASRELNLLAGSINTVLLLGSSLSIAAAELFLRDGRMRGARTLLALTLSLGLAFLCVKGYEYREEYHRGLIPFLNEEFRWDKANPDGAALFFDLYFAMTGLHALHLLIGCVLVATMLGLTARPAPPARRQMQAESIALYWHFVDIVWIFLFPLLYLAR